jgi:hypothetical protein
MYFRIETSIRKCYIWSLNTEPRTRSIGEGKLHVSLGLSSLQINFVFLDMEFCEIKKLLIEKNKIYT